MSDLTADTPSDNSTSHSAFDPPLVHELNDRITRWLLEDPLSLRDLRRINSPQRIENLDVTQAERINRSCIPAKRHKARRTVLVRVWFPMHIRQRLNQQCRHDIAASSLPLILTLHPL